MDARVPCVAPLEPLGACAVVLLGLLDLCLDHLRVFEVPSAVEISGWTQCIQGPVINTLANASENQMGAFCDFRIIQRM